MRSYLVIFGHIDRGVTETGQEYAHVLSVTDKMMLPKDLLDVIPPRLVDNKLTQATDYIIPETFVGEVSFTNA